MALACMVWFVVFTTALVSGCVEQARRTVPEGRMEPAQGFSVNKK
jgi:hypothetical protein